MPPVPGLDSASNLTSAAASIRTAGYSWVGRYLWQDGKGITLSEAQALSNVGLQIMSIYEAAGASLAGFSPSATKKDASQALQYAAAVHQPLASTIYFAGDDFDASAADLPTIRAYFELLRSLIVPATYRLGVYGDGLVCQMLRDAKLVEHTFLAGAMGWHGSQAFKTSADAVQGQTVFQFGLSIDKDSGDPDKMGLWSLPASAPQQNIRPYALTIVGADVIRLQRDLRVAPDGVVGPETLAALAQRLTGVLS